jgi:hypothetical protein
MAMESQMPSCVPQFRVSRSIMVLFRPAPGLILRTHQVVIQT